MNRLKIERYYPKHPLLRKTIKYFWVQKSSRPLILNHKLLPVNNIDIVLNFSAPTVYKYDGVKTTVPRFSFNGIRNQYCTLRQTGPVHSIGISFLPHGLYPLLKIPLSEFEDKTVDLQTAISEFSSKLEIELYPVKKTIETLAILEDCLVEFINPELILDTSLQNLFRMLASGLENNSDLTTFCEHHGIHQKKLERIFNQYVGVSPKRFFRISRFNSMVNQIIDKKYDDFTTLAHARSFYDQSHFIKEFKRFSGSSPSLFVKEKQSIKEMMSIFYKPY